VYLENSWRCYLATIAIDRKAVRSAILATVWLLVCIKTPHCRVLKGAFGLDIPLFLELSEFGVSNRCAASSLTLWSC